ncbi:MAG: hypothetical protein ACI9A2_004559 [Halioglobus sp.]|jgi:hypothetical protein
MSDQPVSGPSQREEFGPTFDAWMALALDGRVPPGTPVESPLFTPKNTQKDQI